MRDVKGAQIQPSPQGITLLKLQLVRISYFSGNLYGSTRVYEIPAKGEFVIVHNETWFIKVLHHQVFKVCKVRRHESLITEEKNLVCVTNTETRYWLQC